jgi:nitrile hydratase
MTPPDAAPPQSPVGSMAGPAARFSVGERVTVRALHPPGHRRTPSYVRGKTGVVERVCGEFNNPEELAYGFDGEPKRTLYRVRFAQNDLWNDYAGPEQDVLELEIYEHWLRPSVRG